MWCRTASRERVRPGLRQVTPSGAFRHPRRGKPGCPRVRSVAGTEHRAHVPHPPARCPRRGRPGHGGRAHRNRHRRPAAGRARAVPRPAVPRPVPADPQRRHRRLRRSGQRVRRRRLPGPGERGRGRGTGRGGRELRPEQGGRSVTVRQRRPRRCGLARATAARVGLPGQRRLGDRRGRPETARRGRQHPLRGRVDRHLHRHRQARPRRVQALRGPVGGTDHGQHLLRLGHCHGHGGQPELPDPVHG